MRKWRAHKIVEAEPIAEINRYHVPVLVLADGTCIDIDDPGERVRFFGEQSKLEVGDFFVRYEDGYRSWSPRAAFEAGYTEIV